ncbi:MAG: hypothetical protein FWG64_01700, partial [Firmicutes bacterium]|nr:hypothetical protein [Bacillota bacterium]
MFGKNKKPQYIPKRASTPPNQNITPTSTTFSTSAKKLFLKKAISSKRFLAFFVAFTVFVTSIALDAFAATDTVIIQLNNPVPASFNLTDEGPPALVVTGSGDAAGNNTIGSPTVVNRMVTSTNGNNQNPAPVGSLQWAINQAPAGAGMSPENPWIVGISVDLTISSVFNLIDTGANNGRHIRLVPVGGNRTITVTANNQRHFSLTGFTHLQIAGNGDSTLTLTRANNTHTNAGGVSINPTTAPAANAPAHVSAATFRLLTGGRIVNNTSTTNGGAILVQNQGHFFMDGGIIENNQAVMGGAV